MGKMGRKLLTTTSIPVTTASPTASVTAVGTTTAATAAATKVDATEAGETTAIATASQTVSAEATEEGKTTAESETSETSEPSESPSNEVESTESIDTSSGDSGSSGSSGSVTFDFTVRIYGGSESAVSELYDYLLDLGTQFANNYASNVEALAHAIDSDGLGQVTINFASIKLYDGDGDEVVSPTNDAYSANKFLYSFLIVAIANVFVLLG